MRAQRAEEARRAVVQRSRGIEASLRTSRMRIADQAVIQLSRVVPARWSAQLAVLVDVCRRLHSTCPDKRGASEREGGRER